MKTRPPTYVWQHPDWPDLRHDRVRVGEALAKARRAQGLVEGEAGMGKSRLLADWQTTLTVAGSASTPATTASAAARPGDAVLPYASLSRLLLSALDRFTPRLDSPHARQAARLLPPAPRKLSEAERVRLTQAARVAGELRAPWGDLLATFEEHGQGDIGLLKLEPDAKAGVVRITGQARDAKSLFAYLHELEADVRLVRVALTTQQLERETPGQPLRFVIQAGWRGAPAAPKEVS